ncbi:hypothetical protein ART_1106 [Arthrobacter sp. PAMC 25486]|uniref:hypothetical protein n=1 Tax=Arthrobacter sp. PAMC 25486 TaxID=1494608 RepID=UPI0005360826|nr:hypothetical protein [Arthrobacter sp. PAMC 25486]AIY00705.1 hypothetical protein ART_1106 [Arthrobacter sp. PAMC 25486]
MSRTQALTTTDTAARPVRDLRRFWRIGAAVLIPLGPLGVTIGRGIMPYWTDQNPDTIVDNVLANPGSITVLNWMGLPLMPALLLGALAMGFVARRGAPVLATIGAGLLFVSWVGSTNTASTDYLTNLLGNNGFDAAQLVQINALIVDDPVNAVAGIFWLFGHLAGMIVLAVALGRAKVVQPWVWIALIASQPVHFIAAVVIPSRLLDLTLGWGLTTLCTVMVSTALVKLSDDEWDLAPLTRRAL